MFLLDDNFALLKIKFAPYKVVFKSIYGAIKLYDFPLNLYDIFKLFEIQCFF